jgi:hypothetical protein
MDGIGPCLDAIEAALAGAASPLSRAVGALSAIRAVRGTCLALAPSSGGDEVLIADGNWQFDRAQTLKNRKLLTLAEFTSEGDFDRLSVMVELNQNDRAFSERRCDLAVAALDVAEALAGIVGAHSGAKTRQFDAGIRPHETRLDMVNE